MIRRRGFLMKTPTTWTEYIAQFIFVIIPIAFLVRTFFFGLYQVPTGSMEHTLLVGERFFADKLTYWFRPPKRGEIIAFNSPDKSVCPNEGYAYSKNQFMNLFQRYVWGPSNWTKRVIAIPGDHIVGKIENDKPVVYLNDKKLEQPYVNAYPLIKIWTDPTGCFTGGRYAFRSFDPNKPFETGQPFYKFNPAQIILNAAGKPSIRYPGTPQTIDVFDITLKDNQYWVMGDNRLNSGDSRAWGILDGKLIHGKIVFRIWSMDSDQAWWPIDLIKHPIGFWSKIRWGRCMQFVH